MNTEKIKRLLDNMNNDHINESSAQCAYYVILSFIPFIILLLTLIQYTSIDANQLFDMISHIIPDNMRDMVIGIIREVFSKSLGTVSWSLIFTLLSADKGLFALTKELHLIYNCSDNNPKSWFYLKAISLIQTVFFIMFIAFGLFAMVFGKTIIYTIKDNFGLLQNYTIFSEIITRVLSLIIVFVVFLFIYKFMSKHKVTFKSQIRGAIFGSIFLNAISNIFSRYLIIFKGFSITYGSLTTLMLVMMWIYSCFYIVFLGAEINKTYDIESVECKKIRYINSFIK